MIFKDFEYILMCMKLWFCYKKVFWKKKLNCNCSLLLFSKSHFVLCTTKYTFKESLKNKLICYCPSHYTVHLFNYYVHGQLTSHFIPPTGIDSKKIIGSVILKSVFSEIRIRTWVQGVSCQKTSLWLAHLSGLPIRGLFVW